MNFIKTTNYNSMKKQFLLLVLLLFGFSCNRIDDSDIQSSDSKIDVEMNEVPYVVDEIYRSILTDGRFNWANLDTYFKDEFDMNFEEEYQKLMQNEDFRLLFSYDESDQSNNGRTQSGIKSYSPINVAQATLVLKATDHSLDYITRITNILPENEEDLPDDIEDVYDRIENIRRDLRTDPYMDNAEKGRYELMLLTYETSFETTLQKVALEMGENPANIRTNGFWSKFKKWAKKAWRKVRSVLVSTAVGVGAGAIAGGGIVGAIIGGVVGLAGSVLDVAVNDVCHFALKCPKGWMQDCSTGDCIERDSWGVNNGGSYGSSGSSAILNPGNDLDKLYAKWYNQKEDDDASCTGFGRCADIPGSLTFNKLDQLARVNGVYDEVQEQYSHLSNSVRFRLYKQRLGRIFEDAVIRSLARPKNTKTFYETAAQINGTIPDVVIETGTIEKKPGMNGSEVTHYFWWNEGAFIDAKISQFNKVSFTPTYNPEQLSRMINILASNNDAETATNFFNSFIGWGTKINKNAAESGAAILHIVTPGGTEIDDAIINAADAKNVYLWHSECEIINGSQLKVMPAKFLNEGLIIAIKADSGGYTVNFDWSKK